jgi:uncharacterized protein (TIGR02118 family)
MTSLVVCIRRKPGMTPEEYSNHWRDIHAPLISNCPNFTRHLMSYTQYHMADAGSAVAQLFGISTDFDGVAVLTFNRADDLTQAFAEPQYTEQIRPDEFNFVDLDNSVSFITDAHQVV